MTCHRASCQKDIMPCPDKETMASCGYILCEGWIHVHTGKHSCADREGDAAPTPERNAA